MIEALKNTAVKPQSEIEEKLIIQLYKLAGYKLGFEPAKVSDDIKRQYHYIGIEGDEIYWTKLEPSIQVRKELTLNQLAWDYNLGPDWATEIIVNSSSYNQLFWANEDFYKNINKTNNTSVRTTGTKLYYTVTSKDPKVSESWFDYEKQIAIQGKFPAHLEVVIVDPKSSKTFEVIGQNSNGSVVVQSNDDGGYSSFHLSQIKPLDWNKKYPPEVRAMHLISDYFMALENEEFAKQMNVSTSTAKLMAELKKLEKEWSS